VQQPQQEQQQQEQDPQEPEGNVMPHEAVAVQRSKAGCLTVICTSPAAVTVFGLLGGSTYACSRFGIDQGPVFCRPSFTLVEVSLWMSGRAKSDGRGV
jgi:hypothetical protein